MNYGYVRVSTEKQSIENQKYSINCYASKTNLKIDSWISETISGKSSLSDRSLGKLLNKVESGDLIITTELSRLGRNLLQIMSILHFCMENDIQVFTVKEGYKLGNNIQSKVLAFAFGLSAEIERQLISERTKEALSRLKKEGVKLGRPVGSKSKKLKLTGKEEIIKKLLNKGISKSQIARELKVHRVTLSKFIESF
ncbi:MAG: master DNA invertase Mpi family serine-type recombinase [Balneola sp.]